MKFKKGDIVKLVDLKAFGKRPSKDDNRFLGNLGIIDTVSNTCNGEMYSVDSSEKLPYHAWYEEHQLEMVKEFPTKEELKKLYK